MLPLQTVAHLKGWRQYAHAASQTARDEGWFTFVDRERITHALAELSLHGHAPHTGAYPGSGHRSSHDGGGGGGGGALGSHGGENRVDGGTRWQLSAKPEERAALLAKDGVHWSDKTNVLLIVDHYLRSALRCALEDGRRS